MFIGHYSAAFLAASLPKSPSLGTLFIGAQLVDLGFFTLVLAGVEQMRITPGLTVMNPMDLYFMPFTHSMAGSAVWALGFAVGLRIICKSWVPAAIGGAVVMSHWLLDLLVHAPDLTLWGSAPKLGFGLWNYPLIEMPFEIALVAAGVIVFLRATHSLGKPYAIVTLVLVLVALQAFNWFAPAPTVLEPSLPITALIAYVVAAGFALWAGQTRTLKFDRRD